MGALVEALAARLGSAMQDGSPVRALRRAGEVWRLTAAPASRSRPTTSSLTVPALGGGRDASRRDAALAAALGAFDVRRSGGGGAGLPTADIPRALDGYGYLVTRREGLATLGVVWESSLFPGRAAAGMALLRVILGGARRPEMARGDSRGARAWPAQELADRARASRADPGHVVGRRVAAGDRAIHARAPRSAARASHAAAGTGAPHLRDVVRRRVVQPRRQERAADGARVAGETWGEPARRYAEARPRRRGGASVSDDGTSSSSRTVSRPKPAFVDQLVYSWRILLGLTRTVAPIPLPLLPLIALARARNRTRLWADHGTGRRSSHSRSAGRGLARPLTAAARAAVAACTSPTSSGGRCSRRCCRRCPADEPVWVVPMYAADSAFTHALSREHGASSRRVDRARAPIAVLPALDGERPRRRCRRGTSWSRRPPTAGAAPTWRWSWPRTARCSSRRGRSTPGLAATEALRAAIAARLARALRPRRQRLAESHPRRPVDRAADRSRARGGGGARAIPRVVYYPYGFLADNAESELEGRIALAAHPAMAARHLPCLNDAAPLAAAIADQVREMAAIKKSADLVIG